jgi:hypothetical protein
MVAVDDIFTGWPRSLLVAGVVLAALDVDPDRVVGLIVAAPLAVFVQGVCSVRVSLPAPARRSAILGGGVLAALWCALLLRWHDFLAAAPGMTWGLAIATAIVSAILARRLARTAIPSAFQSVAAAYETEPAVIAARLA